MLTTLTDLFKTRYRTVLSHGGYRYTLKGKHPIEYVVDGNCVHAELINLKYYEPIGVRGTAPYTQGDIGPAKTDLARVLHEAYQRLVVQDTPTLTPQEESLREQLIEIVDSVKEE